MSKQLKNDRQLPVNKNFRRALSCCGIITVVTFIAFLPSLNNGFTNWDDDKYVIDNPDIKDVTFHNLAKISSSNYLGNYQPLTMLTYMVEYSFFNLNPAIYHCTNLLLHIINCLLVFALIYGLSGSYMTGLLVGLLFAVHPFRVESVAWIAERKDVLSAFFYFFSLLFYIKYLKGNSRKFYWFCVLSLLFSLLSKPMAVSQPFVLFLIDYLSNKKPDKKTILEKIPFFTIAAVFVVITVLTQKHLGAIPEYSQLPMLRRVCVPFYGIIFYLVKSLVPFHLCAYYPFPLTLDSGMTLRLLAAPFLVAGVAVAVYCFRAYSRTLVFGSLFFFITALPVLQIVPVGEATVAERYTYIPLLGLYFIFAELYRFLLTDKFRNNIVVKSLLAAGASIAIAVFAGETYDRCGVWKDSFTLWNDVIAKYPVAIAYNGRGIAYTYQNNYDRAIEEFNQAIRNDQKFVLAYNNRGLAYCHKGDYDRAIEDFTQATKFDPKGALAYINRGFAYSKKDDYDRAIEDYTEGIRLNPANVLAYVNRGFLYKAKGDHGSALDDMKKACAMGFDPACKLLMGN